MQIRVYAMADSGRITPEEAETLELYDPSPASRVRMRSVKLFTDGALGSWGAALLSPYTDKPEVSGIMRLPEEELDRAARTWWSRGFVCERESSAFCGHSSPDRFGEWLLLIGWRVG